ncbi:Flp family type IVb pilin [Cryobacterium lyxosi]|uniref:Flp family type IVb pilin n=2 Tax=Cryobacterium lyxosi TaxID=1259228 RepID=A0A4R8ZDS8_9MICO|nr:Flp family type IVb pilin [Cryobacterium lyxosi]TFD25532.1 Flp family type IVb pilin [Cryobacterium lyxosi]
MNSMRNDEEGATAVEYGLMVSLIAVAIIAAVALIGTNLDLMFDGVGNKLTPPAA